VECFLVCRRMMVWATTIRKVAGSIPDGVTGIFHWHNPSGRTVALGLTQPVTEMSASNNSPGVKAAGAQGWQPYHLHVPTVLKSGSLNHLEPSRPVQACNLIDLPWLLLPLLVRSVSIAVIVFLAYLTILCIGRIMCVWIIIQGDSLARGLKLLSIKIVLLRQWLENLYTHIGNNAKQDLLIIDAENGLLSHPSTLECVYPVVWGL
jgi:hypothetical protein